MVKTKNLSQRRGCGNGLYPTLKKELFIPEHPVQQIGFLPGGCGI
jgi:hypothetical protein